ncbi:zinc finger protein 107-like [Belonocnema kinseyi]|uniref:zinc finger protein 107-like n=1 Tax=Belonocnema kinseyi TaxID=2817044 RepID=UPI00143D01C3|nr:zinc finger protein 107-like [Belonocnema kinseyi]
MSILLLRKSSSDWTKIRIRSSVECKAYLSAIQNENHNLVFKNKENNFSCEIEYSIDEKLEIKEEIVEIQPTSDKILEIKEEIIEDQSTRDKKRNKKIESKLEVMDVKENVNFSVNNKLMNYKQQEIQESEKEPRKKFTCEKCARSYTLIQNLKFHKKYQCISVLPQFSCKFCNKRFKLKNSINRHINQVHNKTSEKKSTLMYRCDECSRSYCYLRSLNQHKRLKHALMKPQFFCDVCGHKCNKKCNLAKHISVFHLESSKTIYKCNKCSRSYKSSDSLNRHKRFEHGADKRRFNCVYCNYQTNLETTLSNHINFRHLNTLRTVYKCDTCSRSYRSSSALNQHKRLEHAAVKIIFVCDYCNYQTNLKSNLSKHITFRHLHKSKAMC